MQLLQQAIQLEEQANHYYLQQANNSKGTPIETAFAMLAEEELKHRDVLKQLLTGSTPAKGNAQTTQAENLFAKLDAFNTDDVYPPSQLQVYRAAMKLEQNMVKLYQQMQKETINPEELRILRFLIGQEQRHAVFMEALDKLLRRPTEWVESAEFGIREEY